jgi:hypothetical protein
MQKRNETYHGKRAAVSLDDVSIGLSLYHILLYYYGETKVRQRSGGQQGQVLQTKSSCGCRQGYVATSRLTNVRAAASPQADLLDRARPDPLHQRPAHSRPVRHAVGAWSVDFRAARPGSRAVGRATGRFAARPQKFQPGERRTPSAAF